MIAGSRRGRDPPENGHGFSDVFAVCENGTACAEALSSSMRRCEPEWVVTSDDSPLKDN